MGDYLTSAFLNLALSFGGMLSSTLNGYGEKKMLHLITACFDL